MSCLRSLTNWSRVGSELFVRNLPDGYWVWLGDLSDELCDPVLKRLERGRAARKAVADPVLRKRAAVNIRRIDRDPRQRRRGTRGCAEQPDLFAHVH